MYPSFLKVEFKAKVLRKLNKNLMNKSQVKGFTLIELLIVIGIIAILATVVILTLNPAELLRQARDSNRTSDLATLKSALALYQADVSSPKLGTSTLPAGGVSGWCYTTLPAGGTLVLTTCGGRLKTGSLFDSVNVGDDPIISRSVSRNTDGTGWIPVNFKTISSGAPLSALPVDPVAPNTAGAGDGSVRDTTTRTTTDQRLDDRYYVYATDGTNTFEINTVLESIKFASSSENDGGDDIILYEAGTQPGLSL